VNVGLYIRGNNSKKSYWDKLEGVEYFRVDISKAPLAKKDYRVRMAPTIIIFKNGIKEEMFNISL